MFTDRCSAGSVTLRKDTLDSFSHHSLNSRRTNQVLKSSKTQLALKLSPLVSESKSKLLGDSLKSTELKRHNGEDKESSMFLLDRFQAAQKSKSENSFKTTKMLNRTQQSSHSKQLEDSRILISNNTNIMIDKSYPKGVDLQGTEQSFLENPSYYKIFEANKRITLREDALRDLTEQMQQIWASSNCGKNALLVSDALSSLMQSIGEAQRNEIELNRAMREMHRQLREKLKLQVESEIYKGQNRLGGEELFLYKQKLEGANADLRLLKKENMRLMLVNDELRKKNLTYEKRLEWLADSNGLNNTSGQFYNNNNNTSNVNDSIINVNEQNITNESLLGGSNNLTQIQQSPKQQPLQMLQQGGGNGSKKRIYTGMQGVLAELVKENETLKKDVNFKAKEMERLKDLNYKQQDKMNRLYKKIDMMKMKKVLKEEDNKVASKNPEDDKFVFERNQLPLTLDFKLQLLSSRQQNFLSELQEHGREPFVNSFEDERKEQIELVVNQMHSFRDFGEKANTLVHELLYILSFNDLNEVIGYISKNFKSTFQAESVHLWVREAETGILKTINQQGKELRALPTRGIFLKSIEQEKIINCSSQKDVVLYQDLDGKVVTSDKCVIFPIYLHPHNKTQSTYDSNSLNVSPNSSSQLSSRYLIGVLEISKLFTENFKADEQYQAILICKVLKFLFKNMHEINVLRQQLRMSTMNEEFFQELCTSTSQWQFQKIIQKHAASILSSSQSQFIFIENKEILLLKSMNDSCNFSSSVSLCSKVIEQKKSMIFYDSRKQPQFIQDIDIASLLPVYYHPIFKSSDIKEQQQGRQQSQEVVGIVQFVIRQRKKPALNQLNEQIIEDQGLLSQDIEYKCFCDYIQSAYQIVFEKQQQQSQL